METFNFKTYPLPRPPIMANKAVSSLLIKKLFDSLILMLEKWRLNEEIVSLFQQKLFKI